MAITKASAQTTVNSGVTAAAAATINQITTAPSTATVVAGGGSLGGVTISNVAITDSTFANVLSGDTAVSSAGGFVRITGTGFKTGANVFLGSTVLANTFVDSTRINANIPATAAGNYQFTVFNTDGSGAISPAGLLISGPPSWTTTSYASGSLTLDVQLLASGDAPLTYYIQPGSANPQNLTVNSAGYLSGTVSAEGAYTITVVVDDAQGQSTQADITTTISLSDPYFNLTVLALPADAAANVWITDASTNNFALTVNGDTRPTAFSPYDTVWSNYFNGSSYLSYTYGSELAFGSGDFTVEFWLNSNSTVHQGIMQGDTNQGWGLFVLSGTFYWQNVVNVSNGLIVSVAAYVTPGWRHWALVRSSGTLSLYIDGQLITSAANSTNYSDASGTFYIGHLPVLGTYINGYLSDLRIVKGTAVYTAAFTPPTGPLTAIANTVLLTCQNNRFIDNSTNNFTLTSTGTTSVSNFAPLVETNTTTGSAYFDGTGDYLRKSGSGVLIANNDVTIECWIYPFSTNIVGLFDGGPGEVNIIRSFGTNKISKQGQEASGASFTVTANVWQHFACTFSSGNIRTYINGVLSGTGTYTSGYAAGSNFDIGGINATGDGAFNGYISNFRVTNSVLYTATFTPPTSPLSAVANTSLLTLQYPVGENNHRFVDSSGFNHLVTRAGNATQGTFSPFSQTGWSNYFDGSGDFLTAPSNAAFQFGTGNFTVEFWLNTRDTAFNIVGLNVGGSGNWMAVVLGGNFSWQDAYATTNLFTTSATSILDGGWHHVAITRQSGTTRLYFDGVSQTSASDSANYNGGGSLQIGSGANGDLLGYISNLRIIKGTALYSGASNFTPPTSPLTAISGTSLLTCQSNRFIDNSTNVFAITRTGDVSVQAFSPFAPSNVYSAATNGGSAYFDGTGDNLTQASGQQVSFGTGNFTIEAWIYWTTSIASESAIMWGNGVGWTLYIYPASRLQWGTTTPQTPANLLTGNTTLTIGRWYHIAVTRSGTTVTLWVNGVSDGTVTDSANYSANGTLDVGISHSSNRFTGYMSGVRVVKGTAVYTSTFTPPTAPPTPIVNTSLLLNFTNAGITDATAKNVLETVGDAKISTVQNKFGGSSMLFDGTGDTLKIPNSQNFVFGSENWTIELWVYLNSTARQGFAALGDGAGSVVPWEIGVGSAGKFRLLVQQSGGQIVIDGTTSPSTGIWYHIAGVRNGGTATLYVNGIAEASSSSLGTGSLVAQTNVIQVGTYSYGFELNGYIDDLRITKGFARYTANFTPPTATFKLR